MAKKRLVMIYHYGPGNEDIAQTDYNQSFGPIKNAIRGIPDIQIEASFCPDVKVLIDKLEQLSDPKEDIEKLYLHFSGHGADLGIPYDDWILKNQALAILLDRPNVEFCFFSSCQSSELVNLVNKRQIPVVIGTADSNDIENRYAIQFQVAFYLALFESRTYFDAFDYAVTKVNNSAQIQLKAGEVILNRGEGGEEILKEDKINALQMVFAQEKHKEIRMLPSNFILEMVNHGFEKPFCLTWSDDDLQRDRFISDFNRLGFDDRLVSIPIEPDQIQLINQRGDNDPILMADSRLLIICSHNQPLPEELRKHLAGEHVFSMPNYQIILCIKKGTDQEIIFSDATVSARFPNDHIFTFAGNSSELFGTDAFVRELDQETINFSERKKATFKFDSKPVKNELFEIVDASKFVRIFFGKNMNERLINFLINSFRSTQHFSCPVLVIDNRINPQLSFKSELQQQIRKFYNIDKGLSRQIIEVYEKGGIVVMRNRSEDINSSISAINDIITDLDRAAVVVSDEIPKNPTLIFFLHDSSDNVNIPERQNICLKAFSAPLPVDKTTIQEWCLRNDQHSVSLEMAQQVKTIASKIKPEEYQSCCPSAVIEFICDELKIPRKQIVGI